MKLPARFVAVTWGLYGLLSALQPCHGREGSKPIVDVRFDAPHQRVEYSLGDNWTPTWGHDDVLYTGSDDGRNFGDIPAGMVAFGKLEGGDPYKLRGITVNRLKEYRDGPLFHRRRSYAFNGVNYSLGQCNDSSPEPEAVCSISPTGRKPLFTSKNFKSPFLLAITKEAALATFGAHADEYVYAAAYSGVIDGEDQYFIGRVSRERLAKGNAADWSFQSEDGSWAQHPETAFPRINDQLWDSKLTSWKVTSTYSLDGTLYMFMARMDDFKHSGDPQGRLVFRDASIVKSKDNGLTWTRSPENNKSRPMFSGQRFGAPYFVGYGKDGAAVVDNADRYVYAISNDGYWESGDSYALGRVLRSQLPNLSAADWSFYRAGDGMRDESWTSTLSEARPILSNSAQAGMTGVTYIEGLGRYAMVSWYYPSHGWRDVQKKGDAYTVLEFFEAERPWGPWTRFKTVHTDRMGWYTPIIGQRFQTPVSSSAVTAFMYTAGMVMNPNGGVNLANYGLNYIPITLSTVALAHNDPVSVR